MQVLNIVNLGNELVKAFSDMDYESFFYEIVESDPVLKKFHQFTFNPPSRPSSADYPVHIKKQEIEILTSEDWEHFFQQYFKTKGQKKACFKYFKQRLEVLTGFIKYLQKFLD